ncbi:MAG: hypothetical protein GY796_20575, partial [Chloroflexi bacterium]|nr:hypothetical protein [Chloroflexota bacterium]
MFLIVGLIMLMTAVAVTFVQAQLPVEDNHWQEKVDAWVLQTADPALAAPGEGLPQTEFLVVLAEQGDVSGADALSTKEEKGQYVYETLMAVARRTQPALINQLEIAGVPYRQFWVVNMIWVQGDMDLVRQMAHRDDVAHIAANPTVKLDLL